MLIYGDAVIADLESVASPDVVAELADVLMRLEKIKWSFCFGFLQWRYPRFGQNDRPGQRRWDSDATAFGDVGAAGGHEMMAGAKIPVKKSRAAKKAFVRQMINRLLDLREIPDRRGKADQLMQPLE